MNSAKPWHLSVTVWGAILTIASSIFGYLKFHPDAGWYSDAGQWLVSLGTLVGGAISLWGRLRATRVIGTAAKSAPQAGRLNGKLKMIAFGLIAAMALCLPGCAFFTSPTPAYVQADRMTHDAVAPEYQAYVHSDKTLSADVIARRDRTVESWELRLETAEAGTPTSASAPPATQPALPSQPATAPAAR